MLSETRTVIADSRCSSLRSVREMRKIQSEWALKKAKENTAPIEAQKHEPVPAEDNFADVNENEEFELLVDFCSTAFKFGSTAINSGSTAINSGSTAFKFDIPGGWAKHLEQS